MNPELSIIIPCRNEKDYIKNCLDSLLAQDYPRDKMEILVIDGMSEDGTLDILKDYTKKNLIKVFENSKKFTPSALNIGIKNSNGSIIMRIDAHASYNKNYVSGCIKYLKKYNVDNVGGVVHAVPVTNSIFAQVIAQVYSHPFGAGYSFFRIGAIEPKLTDTVFGGCYKKEVFKKVGLFNENLIRSQDLEFNIRLKNAGGKILLIPNIISYYHPKATLAEFLRHNFIDGKWAILPLKFIKTPFKLRHYIPLIFVLSLLGTGLLGIFFPIFFWLFLFIFGSYFLAAIYFSVKISTKEKDLRYLFLMPIVFAIRHFGYGIGEIFGVFGLFTDSKIV